MKTPWQRAKQVCYVKSVTAMKTAQHDTDEQDRPRPSMVDGLVPLSQTVNLVVAHNVGFAPEAVLTAAKKDSGVSQ